MACSVKLIVCLCAVLTLSMAQFGNAQPAAPKPLSPAMAALTLTTAAGSASPPAPKSTAATALKGATDDATSVQNKIAASREGPARPQLIAVRGGSLGLPTASESEGVQAGLDAKLVADSSADTFAKVGVVKIADSLAVDVLGETYKADLPRIVLTGSPAVPIMATTGMASVGIRLRYIAGTTLWATKTLTPECIKSLETLKNTTAVTKAIQHSITDKEAQPVAAAVTNTVNDAKAACAIDDAKSVTDAATLSINAGIRFARRGVSTDSFTNIQAVEWELGVRRNSEGDHIAHSEFFGLSGLHVNSSDDVSDGVTTRFINNDEVRVSGGVELRAAASATTSVTPGIGLYGILTRGYWTNDFRPMSEGIHAWQVEGGVYVSGVANGFSGLIEFSVLRPFANQPYQFIISVIPFGGGVPAGH